MDLPAACAGALPEPVPAPSPASAGADADANAGAGASASSNAGAGAGAGGAAAAVAFCAESACEPPPKSWREVERALSRAGPKELLALGGSIGMERPGVSAGGKTVLAGVVLCPWLCRDGSVGTASGSELCNGVVSSISKAGGGSLLLNERLSEGGVLDERASEGG